METPTWDEVEDLEAENNRLRTILDRREATLEQAIRSNARLREALEKATRILEPYDTQHVMGILRINLLAALKGGE